MPPAGSTRRDIGKSYGVVYDFGLMPYALGDVLTWNVLTAIRAERAGCDRVEIHICIDERHPSSIYQWDLITAENSPLFFNELDGAFGTHPRLGNLHVYRSRDELLDELRWRAGINAHEREPLADYERAVQFQEDSDVLVPYFRKYIHSHELINSFCREHGRIPLLRVAAGCGPDVAGLLKQLRGKRIVPFHLRLRRLDAGYGGAHTVQRDSDFLEWYEFLREAGASHPDVQFMALGRLQEKPLELLRLPNVTSLRTLGLGLGHELTLMLASDLFIGTSSGFAAMANFSDLPYFITRMTPESCAAYGVDPGAERLPFASSRQRLVYEPETRELLMQLLQEGLEGSPPRRGAPGQAPDTTVDVSAWEWERFRSLFRHATTYRFATDDHYADKESAFLLWPKVRAAQAAAAGGSPEQARATLGRIERNFPRMSQRFPELLELKKTLALREGDPDTRADCQEALARLRAEARGTPLRAATRVLARGFPLADAILHAARRVRYECRQLWRRKHQIPAKLLHKLSVRLAGRRTPQA